MQSGRHIVIDRSDQATALKAFFNTRAGWAIALVRSLNSLFYLIDQ